jgi:Glycosyl transferase family 2
MNARLTVVMPTHRRPRLIGRALTSVLRQDVEDTLVLVLDNASGDETEAVVAAFARHDNRIQYVRRSQDIGLEANFADGLERVNTPYVAFLPDDDFLLPGCYRTALKALDADPMLGFVALRMVHAHPDGGYSVEASMASGRYEPPTGVLEMVDRGHRTWMGTVFRTACRDAGIRLQPAAGPVLDLDFQLRVASKYPVLALEALGAVYATGPSPENHVKWNTWLDRIESQLRRGYDLGPDAAAASAEAFHQRRIVALFSVAVSDLAARGSSVSSLAGALAGAEASRRAALVRALWRSRAVSRPAIRLALRIRRGSRFPEDRVALAGLVRDELAELASMASRMSSGAPEVPVDS